MTGGTNGGPYVDALSGPGPGTIVVYSSSACSDAVPTQIDDVVMAPGLGLAETRCAEFLSKSVDQLIAITSRGEYYSCTGA